MGTPNENVWPGVTHLKDFKATFPKWSKDTLHEICPKISIEGVDLLRRMLAYDPVERITAEEALDHPYFASINRSAYASREY